MTKDLKMMDRIWVRGLTKFEKWKVQFEENMVNSTIEDMMKVAVIILPPEQMAMMSRGNPELEKMIATIKGGTYG